MKFVFRNLMSLILGVSLLSSCSFQRAGYRVKTVPFKQREPIQEGVYYALPQTVLRIDVEVQKSEFQPGKYSSFAPVLLGQYSQEGSEMPEYKLADIRFSTYSEADPNAYFFVEFARKAPSISKLENGVIQSFNQPMGGIEVSKKEVEKEGVVSKNKNYIEPIGSFKVKGSQELASDEEDATQGEVGMVDYAKTYRTMLFEKPSMEKAKEAAEIIVEIRNKKRELIYGEYEDEYSKKSPEYILQELTQMEKDFESLFLGRTLVKKEVKSFFIAPDKSLLVGDEQSFFLCGFSSSQGLREAEEGFDPIYIRIRSEQDLFAVSNFEKKRKNTYNKNGRLLRKGKKKEDGMVYRMPENALVQATYKSEVYSEKVRVNQYGVLLRLPQQRLEIHFDTETGNVIHTARCRDDK